MSTLFHRLKSLYVLDVVLQTGSFSLAAEKLYMTQSAVSQHIKQLETDIGPLFIRQTRALQPTAQAENLRSNLKKRVFRTGIWLESGDAAGSKNPDHFPITLFCQQLVDPPVRSL